MPDLNRTKFDQAIENLAQELAKLRTGRANPAVLEDLKVDYYGTPTPVKQLGSISVPEARQLVIAPWDKNALAPMEKAIRDCGLALTPVNEGDKLRITLPQLNEERRRELAKIVGKTAEEARVRVRAVREELWREIKKLPNEDERFRQQEALQKVVDEYNAKIKTIAEAKEKEIMTV